MQTKTSKDNYNDLNWFIGELDAKLDADFNFEISGSEEKRTVNLVVLTKLVELMQKSFSWRNNRDKEVIEQIYFEVFGDSNPTGYDRTKEKISLINAIITSTNETFTVDAAWTITAIDGDETRTVETMKTAPRPDNVTLLAAFRCIKVYGGGTGLHGLKQYTFKLVPSEKLVTIDFVE